MLDEAAHHQERTGLGALTPRELEVLEMISFGMTNAEAARRLQVSVHAIKFHLAAIYSRLGVSEPDRGCGHLPPLDERQPRAERDRED